MKVIKISRLDRGIAHGGSGYSICFTRLFGKTKKRKYLNIALELLKYDIKRNKKENQRSRKIYWCHGAAGIVLAQQENIKNILKMVHISIFLKIIRQKLA